MQRIFHNSGLDEQPSLQTRMSSQQEACWMKLSQVADCGSSGISDIVQASYIFCNYLLLCMYNIYD